MNDVHILIEFVHVSHDWVGLAVSGDAKALKLWRPKVSFERKMHGMNTNHVPLPRIGAPATRALAAVGVHSLGDAERYGIDRLATLHGVGPKAIRLLRDALAHECPAPQMGPGTSE